MKKITLIVASILATLGANAQILTDGFESSEGYAVGDYIGPGPNGSYWTTWSGAEGGAEDAQVTSAQANTGTNSVYFSSNAANGGPQDVILNFGQQYTDGVFTFETALFVNTGGNAYFNFQATPVPGTTWAMNCNLLANGTISIDDGLTNDLATGSYTQNTWLTLRIEANLTLGIWEAFVDGNSIGSWTNGINQIASADIFPVQGSAFYIDDVMFDHQPYTLPNLNAIAGSFNIGGNIAGLNVLPKVNVVNGGVTALTSFDVTVDYNGNQYTETVSGVNLASTTSYLVTFTTPIALVGGTNNATATISNINGGADDNPSDDVLTITVDPVIPAPGKVVVGEEGTGTWCQWCPRGAVFMDRFEQDFGPFWAGIAVHNADPMTVATYDAGIGGLISGYPSAIVDRGNDVDPSAMTNDFFTRLQTAPTAVLTNNATWDAGTRELVVTVTADFQSAANSNYKLAVVLTEDGVTGTTSGYAQSNAYAGGGNGVMGGYELLPNPVPASQMVYDHVARAIEPSFTGDASSFPATVNAGEQHSRTYTFTLPADWNEGNMHIISMILAPNGTIDNAGKSTIPGTVGIDEVENNDASFSVYPNPASTHAIVEVNLPSAADVAIRLLDMSGKEVSSRNFGSLESSSAIQLTTEGLQSGVYLVEVSVNNQRMTKRLIVE